MPQDGAIPKMKAAQKPKRLLEVFPQRIPKESSLEAHGNSCRQQEGDKELLPVIPAPLKVGNRYYHPMRLGRNSGIDSINKVLDGKCLAHADPLLFFALQRDNPEMADKKHTVIFWMDKPSGGWCHCICGLDKKGIRYIKIGPVWGKYPGGTIVITAPLSPLKVFI
jgi:hypothetical protein